MKEMINELTNEELLINVNEESESKVSMGVSNLVNKKTKKAHELFDKALEISHKCPAAWLGKAYTDAYTITAEDSKMDSIDHSLGQVKSLVPSNPELIANHYGAILSILVYKTSELIKGHLNTAIAMKKEAEGAATDAALSLLVGVAGAAVGSSSKSVVGKVAGWSAAGAGAGKMVSNLKASGDYDTIANSVYALAMGQLIGSINLIQIADSITANVSEPVKKALNSAITEWKKSSLLLYKAELLQLSVFVEKLSSGFSSGTGKIDDLLKQKKDFKEVAEVKVLADIVGLDNHKSVDKLDSFFKEIKKSTSTDEHDELKAIKKKRYIKSAVLFIAGGLWMEIMDPEENSVSAFVGIIPLLSSMVYGYKTWKLKSAGQESLVESCDEFAKYLESVSIKPKEIDLKLLG